MNDHVEFEPINEHQCTDAGSDALPAWAYHVEFEPINEHQWRQAKRSMAEDGLKHACLSFAQLPAAETFAHLRKRLAEYEQACIDTGAAG